MLLLLTNKARRIRFNALLNVLQVHRRQLERHASDPESVRYHSQGIIQSRAERLRLARYLYPRPPEHKAKRLPHKESLQRFGEALD